MIQNKIYSTFTYVLVFRTDTIFFIITVIFRITFFHYLPVSGILYLSIYGIHCSNCSACFPAILQQAITAREPAVGTLVKYLPSQPLFHHILHSFSSTSVLCCFVALSDSECLGVSLAFLALVSSVVVPFLLGGNGGAGSCPLNAISYLYSSTSFSKEIKFPS